MSDRRTIPAAREPQGIEKRQFGRRRTMLHGMIYVTGRPVLPCMIHNISEGGALLVCDNPTWLPFYFRLTIESENLDADCEVRHQTGAGTGVFFKTKRPLVKR